MKLLYLVNRNTYQTKMSRVRFHGIDAVAKLVSVTYWGANWPGYDVMKTVQDNLDTLNQTFDMAIIYKPLELKGVKELTIPKCIRYNEMYDTEWTLQEIRESGCQLVICHHNNDYERYQAMKIPNITFIYIGHCANSKIWKPMNLPIRYDISIAGYLSDYYPLRKTFYQALRILQTRYRCYVHPHPGYDLTDAHTDRYLREMATVVNQSKICVTCSSRFQYRLGKYIEIPMCGTSAICGDLPKDNADDYSYVIEVTNDMSLQEIVQTLSYYLENEDKRLEKVKKGIEFAKHYTQEQYAERLVKTIQNFLS